MNKTTDRPRRCVPALPLAALLAISLSACAAGPAGPGTSVTHLCKPKEVVGFSCELHDKRLLSMCASPGFDKFNGLPENNPGYAYLAVGNRQGRVQHQFPSDPNDYKKHMRTGVTVAAWPYLSVSSDKGEFFYINGDKEVPVTISVERLPPGWALPTSKNDSDCNNRRHIENFDSVLMRLPHQAQRP